MLRPALSFSTACCVLALALGLGSPARGEGDWEITPESDKALRRGIDWLARTHGPEGNWESNDLGLVSMGALAFLAAGHTPGVGQYGKNVDRALNYVLKNAKPSGLLNIADAQRDMYNHGLSTFVLGQAFGMTSDPRMGPVLDRALKLIANTQCNDGGWDYRAKPQPLGHDLSLAVMQAKALRSAVDSGLEVSPEVIDLAIKSVREHYKPANGQRNASDAEQQKVAGQFTYDKGGGQASIAMAAAGVVCLQEFGQYEDWRIGKTCGSDHGGHSRAEAAAAQRPGAVRRLHAVLRGPGALPGGRPKLDRQLPQTPRSPGRGSGRRGGRSLRDGLWRSGGHVGGHPGELYGTAVACFRAGNAQSLPADPARRQDRQSAQ